jgi:hypothetical protein
MRPILILLLLTVIATTGHTQVLVQGRVFDVSKRAPLESVAVLTTGGRGAITDSAGRFSINAGDSDSIYFSYQGKNTNKFAVSEIKDHLSFEISIHVVATELPGVTVKNRNYLIDSIQNRKDYAKIFNYKKPTLKRATTVGFTPGGVGVAFDLQALIQMFQFRKNRQMLAFQKRLLQEEQDKYVDKRFSKRYITRLTGLQGVALDSFMLLYRPAYEFVLGVNDLELGVYIQMSFEHFELVRKGEMSIPPKQTILD